MFNMEDDDTFEGNTTAAAGAIGGREATSVKQRKTTKGPPSSSSGKMEHRHRAQSIIQSKALDELETEVFETGLYENADFARGSRVGVMIAEVFYSELNYTCTFRCIHTLHNVHAFALNGLLPRRLPVFLSPMVSVYEVILKPCTMILQVTCGGV